MLAAIALLAAIGPAGQAPPAPRPDDFKPDASWRPLGAALWFDPAGRRLLLRAQVVLREGPLEHLICLKGTKEHEAILATKAVPRQIHAGLLLTGAEPGGPVQYVPKFRAPTGTPIAIDLEWDDGGEKRSADARNWVLDEQAKKPLAHDWVFAGSLLVEDPETKERHYLADDGDLVTVANFATAILDVPFASSAEDAGRLYVARTEAIPPQGTYVTVSLKPRAVKPAPPPPARP